MCVMLCQVLPEYLKRSIGGLLTDPFVSACLPEVVAALQPQLSQLQPKAAELLNHIDLAATQSTQLGQVLQQVSQVTSDHTTNSATMTHCTPTTPSSCFRGLWTTQMLCYV